MDGLDYTFRRGLPFAVPHEGVPENIEILAMSPAQFAEDEIDGPGFRYYVSDSDYEGWLKLAPEEDPEEARERYRYGSGMLVHMPKGEGHVVTGGSCEWVVGLARQDPFTMKITRNVIARFAGL